MPICRVGIKHFVSGEKNGKLKICIDFKNLKRATPKDEYPMLITDLLVDVAFGHKIIIFMDGNASYNQIFMVEEDITKTAFRCPGAIDLCKWIIITFDLKNAKFIGCADMGSGY
jgi:hypothetical protein